MSYFIATFANLKNLKNIFASFFLNILVMKVEITPNVKTVVFFWWDLVLDCCVGTYLSYTGDCSLR